MKTRSAIFALVLLILPWAPVTAADKVIISYSSRSYAFLPAQIAVVKGFFKDENLEPLLIQMRSQVTVPALLSGTKSPGPAAARSAKGRRRSEPSLPGGTARHHSPQPGEELG